MRFAKFLCRHFGHRPMERHIAYVLARKEAVDAEALAKILNAPTRFCGRCGDPLGESATAKNTSEVQNGQ